MKIWFDMDGTIADLYGIEDWKMRLNNEDVAPYANARPLVNMSALARLLHKAQRNGYEIGIISWTSKSGSDTYHEATAAAKCQWLARHLPSVRWDEIRIVAYGTPKSICGEGFLFDDEEGNRTEWGENAFEPSKIFEVLRSL